MFNLRSFTMLLMAVTVMNGLRFIIAIFTVDVRSIVFCGAMMIIFIFEFKYMRGINEEFKSIMQDLKDKYHK